MEENVNKSHPTPTFPKLGMPDDRRETPIISTQRQREIGNRSIASSSVGHMPPVQRELARPRQLNEIQGIPIEGLTGHIDPRSGGQSAPSYALNNNLIDKDPTVNYHENYPQSTKLHEDFHQMMNRVEHKYGEHHRNMLSRRMVMSLPEELRNSVKHLADTVTGSPSNDYEEMIAHAISYVNSGTSRAIYERRAADNGMPPENWLKDANIKQAMAYFRNYAQNITPYQLTGQPVTKDELDKSQPTPTFPKLGLPDNRRETPIISTPQQQQLGSRAVANAAIGSSGVYARPSAKKTAVNTLSSELTGPGVQGITGPITTGQTAPGYALSNKLLDRRYKEASEVPVATKLHEDFHQMMNRIENRYGWEGRKKVAMRLVSSLPPELLHAITRHAYVMTDSQQEPEELIAHTITYVNSPTKRLVYHNNEDMMNTPHEKRADDLKMKAALRHFRNKAETIAPKHIGIKKSENFDELAKSLDVKKIDRIVEKVKSHLSDDLRQPQYRGKENCLAGHCYVASEAVYHMLGGQQAGWVPQSIQHEGGPHWYLKHKFSGFIVDPTVSQFNTPPDYSKGVGRGFLTRQPSKRAQTVLDRVAKGHSLAKMSDEQWQATIKEVCTIAIFNSDGFLLMGQRNDDKKWNCPGGKMEPGENPRKAALREAFEETGIELKSIKHLGDGRGGKDGHIIVHCFEAHSDEAPNSENDPDEEVDKWEWVDVRGGLPSEFNEHTLHNGDNDVLLHILGLQQSNKPQELSKSWKNAFIGAVTAAGLASTPALADDHPGEKTTMKWSSEGLHEDLHPIAQLESSGGKNVKHVPHSKGEFHTAVGAVGLKPVTAAEEYNKSSWLQKVFPGMHDAHRLVDAMNNNPAFYNGVASAHWQRLKKFFGGDRSKAAYAWRWGIGAAQRDTPEVQAADPYVLAYQKLWNKTHTDKVGQFLVNPLQDLTPSSNVTPQAQNRLEKAERSYFRSKDGITIPAHGTSERAFYNQKFEQGVKNAFPGAQLRKIKVPLDKISGGTNMPVNKERLEFYKRMARHDKLPPIVVNKTGGGYYVTDGNHREAAARHVGLKEIDAFEIVKDEKPKKIPISKDVKLYDIGDDPHGLLQPKVKQTKYGQLFEPVEMEDVHKKLKRMGYHGYTGHSNNPDEHVLFE